MSPGSLLSLHLGLLVAGLVACLGGEVANGTLWLQLGLLGVWAGWGPYWVLSKGEVAGAQMNLFDAALRWEWVRPLYVRRVVQGLLWAQGRFTRHGLGNLVRYAVVTAVPVFTFTSVFGFALLVAMYAQAYSGLLLALYYLPDPTFAITIREDLFVEVWWFLWVYKLHVIGVDLLFTLSYLHLANKLYLRNYAEGDLDGWFTGAYAFLVYHLVVFLGITLSTNHLGDVTIMIAANIYWSLFCQWHKAYAPFFTNKHLSTDQLLRFMLAHYLSAWYYLYLVQTHVLFVHEMWDADGNRSTQQTSLTPKGSWVWDALSKEALLMVSSYLTVAALFFLVMHPDSRTVNFSFFEQWAEAEVEEINFFIVAPHWYFRPHMGLLTVCAHHYEGLAWFVAFYLLLCYMPHLYSIWGGVGVRVGGLSEADAVSLSLLQWMLYLLFVSSLLYVGGTLPCGRFYYESVDGFFGNSTLRLSYQFIYLYLGLGAHLVDSVERALVGSVVNEPR